MSARNVQPHVHDVMSAVPPLAVEVASGAPFELLIGLYALTTPDQRRDPSWVPPTAADCPRATRAAIEAIGDRAGEVWLHLLGLALELEADDAPALVEALERVDAIELRRHVVGVYVPTWRNLVGGQTLARAAKGDRVAVAKLLGEPRYYGQRARESLERLLPLSAAATKARLLEALRVFADEVLAPVAPDVAARLAAEARKRRQLAARVTGEEAIDAAARGYVYEREHGLDRVVLVPHLAARPWLLLCQHRDARVICYATVDEEDDPERARADRILNVGRALGDRKRLAILYRLRRGDATLQELADELGIAKSTTHHHLAQLRAARLIALRGNASGYAYTLDPTGFLDGEHLLADFRTAVD